MASYSWQSSVLVTLTDYQATRDHTLNYLRHCTASQVFFNFDCMRESDTMGAEPEIIHLFCPTPERKCAYFVAIHDRLQLTYAGPPLMRFGGEVPVIY